MKYMLLTSCLLLTSCATMPSGVRNIREGMTKENVLNNIGKPDGMLKKDGLELLTYANRMIPWTNDKADYYVLLQNGNVVSYGTDQIRQNATGLNALFVMPLNTQPTYQPMPPPPPLMPGYSYGH
jgi:hypothetical protein